MTTTPNAPPNESADLITPGDMHLTVINRAMALRAIQRKNKSIKRIRRQTVLRVYAALGIEKEAPRKKRIKRITPPSAASVRRTKKRALIVGLHDKGWAMKAIVAETGSAYAYVDKVLREHDREPNYRNARPKAKT